MLAGDYIANFTSILTPASNDNGMLVMQFVRNTDSAIVVTSRSNSTVDFPDIATSSASTISLASSYYLLEGDLMELQFSISPSTAFNSSSIIQFHVPHFFSAGGSDFDWNVAC